MGGILLMIEKQEFEEIMASAIEKGMENYEARLRSQEETSETDKYMSAEEVCKYLKLKRSALYQWTMKGIIPFSKGSDMEKRDSRTGRRRLIFDKEEIDKWVLDGQHLTRTERDMERELRITKAINERKLLLIHLQMKTIQSKIMIKAEELRLGNYVEISRF